MWREEDDGQRARWSETGTVDTPDYGRQPSTIARGSFATHIKPHRQQARYILLTYRCLFDPHQARDEITVGTILYS